MEATITANIPGIKVDRFYGAVNAVDTDNKAQIAEAEDNYYKIHSFDFNRWPIDFLSDYIYNEHHCFYYEQEPVLSELVEKVINLYGTNNDLIQRLKGLYRNLKQELNEHFLKEERVLFPYIKNLAIAKRNFSFPMPSGITAIAIPIQAMEAEHATITKLVEEIKTVTNGYTPPGNAGNSLRLLYGKLQALENDLQQHMYLETNILFPKAISAEKELKKLRLL